jgi:hypothetical protein
MALAFNRDRCDHLALCLQLILFHCTKIVPKFQDHSVEVSVHDKKKVDDVIKKVDDVMSVTDRTRCRCYETFFLCCLQRG